MNNYNKSSKEYLDCLNREKANKIAIEILKSATDLIRAIEYKDNMFINLNLDKIIKKSKLLKYNKF